MQRKLHVALLMFAFALFNFALSAQVTTATMTGEVMDNSGEPLIGAAVTALHVPSGVTYGTTTRVDGSYTLPNLRVGGPYTIEATYVGYKTAKLEGAQLTLAQKLRMDFTL